MSEGEGGGVERPVSNASPEVQAEARNMGWAGPDSYKGPAEKYMDADAYIERGKHVLPIVNATNARLKAELEAQRQTVAQTQATLREAQEAIVALREYQSEETARQVKEARKAVIKEIAAAREAGDTELEIELQDSLSELKEVAAKPVAKPAAPVAAPQQNVVHPDYPAWERENSSWFGVDEELTALTTVQARKLRRDPANAGLIGRAFFDRAAAEARAKLYGPGEERRTSKSEGSGGGGGVGGGVAKARSVKDLPADARSIVQDPKRISKLVGAGKVFKDKAAWEAHYVAEYFNGVQS